MIRNLEGHSVSLKVILLVHLVEIESTVVILEITALTTKLQMQMAESVGFEPTEPVTARQFSKLLH